MDYKIKNKGGRPRKIKDVEELETLWNEYVDYIDANPWKEKDFKGNNAKEVTIKKKVPFTKFSFAHFCGLHSWEVIKDLKAFSPQFSEVVKRIESLIYDQKMNGASVGSFNSSIIASDLGLKNRIENSGKVGLTLNVSGDVNEALNNAMDDIDG